MLVKAVPCYDIRETRAKLPARVSRLASAVAVGSNTRGERSRPTAGPVAEPVAEPAAEPVTDLLLLEVLLRVVDVVEKLLERDLIWHGRATCERGDPGRCVTRNFVENNMRPSCRFDYDSACCGDGRS